MLQAIVSFEQDDEGAWVARLACGHTQHVRHNPPQDVRRWVLHEASRNERLGTKLDCLFCDMPALPERAVQYKETDVFTDETVPEGLLRDHRTKAGTWGRIRVLEGKLLYQLTDGARWVLRPGVDGTIEPERPHRVRPLGPVRFSVAFYRIDR